MFSFQKAGSSWSSNRAGEGAALPPPSSSSTPSDGIASAVEEEEEDFRSWVGRRRRRRRIGDGGGLEPRQLRLGFGLKWGAEASQATGRWPISNLGSRRLRGGSPVQICRGRLLPKIFLVVSFDH